MPYAPGTGDPMPDPISRLSFRWRYTLAEQVAIKRAETEHASADVRATLQILRESLAEADEVLVDDPRTMAGVAYHAQAGLIAPERVAEILAP